MSTNRAAMDDQDYTMKVAGNIDVSGDIDYTGTLLTNGREFREQIEQISFSDDTVNFSAPLAVLGDIQYSGTLRNDIAIMYPGSRFITDDGVGTVTVDADLSITNTKTLRVSGALKVTEDVSMASALTVGETLLVEGRATLGSLVVGGQTTGASLVLSGQASAGSLLVTGSSVLAGATATSLRSSGGFSVAGTSSLATTTATAFTCSGIVRTVTLEANGTSYLADVNATSINSMGDLTVGGKTTINNLLSGAITSVSNITAYESISAGTNLSVEGSSTLAGLSCTHLYNSGALTAASVTSTGAIAGTSLSVSGTSTLASVNATALSSSNSLSVTGTSTLGTTNTGALGATSLSTTDLITTGSAAVGTTLSVADTSTLAGVKSTFIENSGSLLVSGLTTLGQTSAGELSATSLNTTTSLSVGSTLQVTSGSTLNSVSANSLAVSGVSRLGYTETGTLSAATISSYDSLTVPGQSTLSAVNCGNIMSTGGLSTAQAVSVGANLDVAGALTVAAGKQSTLNGAVVVENDLTMTSGRVQFSINNSNTSVPGGLGARIRYSTTGGTATASEYATGLGSSTLWHNTPSSGAHVFYTSGTERIRVNASGFTVGTSSNSIGLTVNGTSLLNDSVTIANSKALAVTGSTTTNSADVTTTLKVGGVSTLLGDVNITSSKLTVGGNTSLSTVSTTGLATLQSATVTAALLANGSVTLGDASTDVVLINGGATFANGLTSTTGATYLGATQASSLTSSGQVQAGSLAVTGLSNLASLSAAATTVTALVVNGDSSTTGQVSAASVLSTGAVNTSSIGTTGAATIGGLLSASAGLSVTGNASISGNVAVNSLNIKGRGQFGTVFDAPAISGQSVVASSDRLIVTLSPVSQTPLGILSIMVPVVNTLNISITPSGGSATVYQISPSGAAITTISLFAYLYSTPSTLARFATSSTTSYEIYGLTPGTTYSLSLSYSNDMGTGTSATLNTSLLIAGKPAAPTALSGTAATVTGDYSPYTFTWTAPSVTDSSNPALNPQPAISKYTYQYTETSTVSSVSSLSSSGALVTTSLPTTTSNLRPGTVYSLTASATNSVNTSAGTTSSPYVFATDYPESRFNTGTLLTNAATLTAPSVGSAPYTTGRFPAVSYISRANVALTSSNVLVSPSFTVTLSNLRINDEPNPTSSGASCSTFALAHSGGATATISLLYTDSTTKTNTSSYCTLTLQSLADCNTTGEQGFYKQVGTATLALASLPGQYASQSITLTQTLTKRGAWSYSSNAYSYMPSTASNTYVRSNALSFYVEDTTAVPTIVNASEKTSARTSYASPSIISGVGSVPVSSSAFTATVVVAASRVGSYWFPVGSVATVVGTAPAAALTNTSLSNTTSVCQPLYSDAAATAAVASGTSLVSTTTYYRSVPATLSTVGITALYSSFACAATCANISGSSGSAAFTVGSFRFDGSSLAHPHMTSVGGQSTLYGERVTFTGTRATYPNVSLESTYSHSENIVTNSSKSYYTTEQVLYNGAYAGSGTSAWAIDYSAQSYLMHASTVLPNYASPGSATRYACFKWWVDTSSSFQTIGVTLTGANSTTESKTVMYKFVDMTTGAGTTKWLDLFSNFAGGAITSAADGAAARLYSNTSTVASNTLTSVTSSGVIYVYIGIPSTSSFTYTGVTITDYTSGAILLW